MAKSGWWYVSFEITLDGEEVRWEDLSESSQEHILKCIMEGYCQGEVVEPEDDEEYEVEYEEEDEAEEEDDS